MPRHAAPPPKGLAFAEMTVDKVLPPLRMSPVTLGNLLPPALDLCGALVSRGAETTIERQAMHQPAGKLLLFGATGDLAQRDAASLALWPACRRAAARRA